MRRFSLLFILITLLSTSLRAQQYTGMEGLLHVPSGEMDSAGVARIGAHFICKDMLADRMKIDGEKYNTATNYLSITPFSWIEIGYAYTLWKFHKNMNKKRQVGFYSKDRYFSLRIQPLKEGKYWPSVVLGGNDVWGQKDGGESGSNFYRNFYIATTKHFDYNGWNIGTTLSYRKWKQDYFKKWNGVVGGVTVNPPFYKPLRVIAEWDGNEMNMGADCTLFKYFLLQASLLNMQHFCGGLCFRINLL